MLDPLTLDQLRVLVAVADEGSFSAAARRLGRVQSAISQAVQSMETALRVTLFDRDGKIPQLNDAGRVLLADARRLLSGAEAFKAQGRELHRRRRARTDAGGRCPFPECGADREPQGAQRGLFLPAGHGLHRGDGRRRTAASRRRGAACPLRPDAGHHRQPRDRISRDNSDGSGGRRQASAGLACRGRSRAPTSRPRCSSCSPTAPR